MTAEQLDALLLPLFALNSLLVLVDASVGYHLAPLLFRVGGGVPEAAETGVRMVRRLLTGVVVLYMFFNCLAFFRYNAPLLMIVTVLVLVDLGGQFYVRYRTRQQDDMQDHP